MAFSSKHIPVEQTGSFSSLVVDYLSGNNALRPFFKHPPNIDGIKAAIEGRKAFPFDRQLLIKHLHKQYEGIDVSPRLKTNLDLLSQEDTFTVCTAHQPNLFTGHLYFVYKILHAVKLADVLSAEIPGKNFIPVFYMGSEDADLEELGSIEIGGKKYTWNTPQKGAVGRMKVDGELTKLVEQIAGQISVLDFGKEIISILRNSYAEGRTIEEATFLLINSLFGHFGVVVLLPDDTELKRSFSKIFEKELQDGFSARSVETTLQNFPSKYKVQAGGREINLFYLAEQSRERIERTRGGFKVNNSEQSFTQAEISEEIKNHPERFSPNVILRPLYQEWILPNVAFIGGGGELAYWLELKGVFEKASVPMPVLVLRNSFLLIRKRWVEKLEKWNISPEELFKGRQPMIKKLVQERSAFSLDLDEQVKDLDNIFNTISSSATAHDQSLEKHVLSIRQNLLKKVTGLEKKMYRSAKKREEALLNQVDKMYSELFPGETLQERVENIIPYYATWGAQFLDVLLENSGSLEQDFTIFLED